MEMCCGFFGNAALREIFQIPTVYRQGDIVGKIEIGIGVDWIANFGRRLCLRAPSCSVQEFVDVFHNVFKTAMYGGFDEFVLVEFRFAVTMETVAKSCFFIEIDLPIGVAAHGTLSKIELRPV